MKLLRWLKEFGDHYRSDVCASLTRAQLADVVSRFISAEHLTPRAYEWEDLEHTPLSDQELERVRALLLGIDDRSRDISGMPEQEYMAALLESMKLLRDESVALDEVITELERTFLEDDAVER